MKMLSAADICRYAENLAPLESQKEYRHRIANFIRMHTARLRALDSGVSFSALPINSMMIIAQTGCGKSYTAARLCEAAGVELITIDCSSLTRAGWKGCNLGDLLYSAKHSSDHKFQDCIILFDEVDKMRIDVPEGNPQVNFLKLFEGFVQADPRGAPAISMDLRRVSFLFAGAFSGLEDIVRRRTAPRAIGFSAQSAAPVAETDPLSLATMADIREYGFMEELLGRIGSLFYIPPLTPSDYRMLLKSTKGSVQERYGNLLSSSGVSLSISDSACAHIALEASQSLLGARSVEPLVYRCLQNAFEKVDSDKSINRVILSCREGALKLTYGHGERSVPVEEDDDRSCDCMAAALKLPDVSIARYLDSDEDALLLCDMALWAFDKPVTRDERRLKVFLRCCLRYMRTLGCESDKVLSSLTKLADATKPDERGSCFDRIVKDELKRRFEKEEDREKLQDAYNDYHSMHNENNHLFWAPQLVQVTPAESLLMHSPPVDFFPFQGILISQKQVK